MKKIIDGRKYDTDTARRIGSHYSCYDVTDFQYYEEHLYQKQNGEYFLWGKGGPLSKYSTSTGNSWTGGSDFTPISFRDAREWCEKNLTVDEYESIFGIVEE